MWLPGSFSLLLLIFHVLKTRDQPKDFAVNNTALLVRGFVITLMVGFCRNRTSSNVVAWWI